MAEHPAAGQAFKRQPLAVQWDEGADYFAGEVASDDTCRLLCGDRQEHAREARLSREMVKSVGTTLSGSLTARKVEVSAREFLKAVSALDLCVEPARRRRVVVEYRGMSCTVKARIESGEVVLGVEC